MSVILHVFLLEPVLLKQSKFLVIFSVSNDGIFKLSIPVKVYLVFFTVLSLSSIDDHVLTVFNF